MFDLDDDEELPAAKPDEIPGNEALRYRKLALCVIAQAMTDAGFKTDGRLISCAMVHIESKASRAVKLSRVKRRIDACRFLIERNDAIRRHWFALAGKGALTRLGVHAIRRLLNELRAYEGELRGETRVKWERRAHG